MGEGRGGGAEHHAHDLLGRIYEYFLSQFATAEGKKGGEFYTPRCVVKLLVEMIEPYRGRVYDPCCGSSGMFVQSVEFIRHHANGNGNGGKAKGDISIYGQESNYTTSPSAASTVRSRTATPSTTTATQTSRPTSSAPIRPSTSPTGAASACARTSWQYGAPPAGNANFAWVQHIVHHLAPAGVAGFVLANGSMSSNQSGEGEIRKRLIETDLVDCMMALPGQLFYSTQIPACLWFLARDRRGNPPWLPKGAGTKARPYRDRRGQVLFIDARKLGRLVDRTHRELTDEDVARIADTYHAWRGSDDVGASLVLAPKGDREGRPYEDVPGFCKSATLEDVRKHGHVLTPGRYVGAEALEDDGEPFEEKMRRLTIQREVQFAESTRLEEAIRRNLNSLGLGDPLSKAK